MVIDVITYNGEKDLFEIRYNILKDYVDEFIVVEFNRTFSGKIKESTFSPSNWDKVSYHFHTDINYSKYNELAYNSPNTEGAAHWKMEFMQKESIRDCLTHLKDDDIVFIGDVDEIWNPTMTYLGLLKLKLNVYTYFLNNKSSEQFWGTIRTKYKYIKDECLNHLRTRDDIKTSNVYGWHFTSMGGYEEVKKKLTDSYTEESYASPVVMDNLKDNVENSNDFLGRGFTYTVDESNWPQYLKDNRESYTHLLRK